MGCNTGSESKPDLKPIYTNFENAWEELNLYGKVKSIKLYRTNLLNNGQPEKPILSLSEKYTDFGQLMETEIFGNLGKLVQKDTYENDDNRNHIRTISTYKFTDTSEVITVEYNTINNKSLRIVSINDKLEKEITVYSDDRGFITKRITVEKNDTTIVNYKYIFDQSDNLIREIKFEVDENSPIQSLYHKYNEIGNLIESSTKTDWIEYLTEIEWKDNRIYKETEYTISADLEKQLERIIEYDRQFNPVNIKNYKNSKLDRELKYDYEFDQSGNWIKRKVFMKEHFVNSKKFIPVYIESREIKYWN